MATRQIRSELSPPIKSSFQQQVKTLAEEAREIVHSYADLTQRILKLSERIKRLSDQARAMDKDKDGGEYQRYLQNTIAAAIGTTDKSVVSKFVTIGSQAKVLLTYKDKLPRQRDGLYEVALDLKRNKPVQKWIETEKITDQSSVREVRALNRKPKPKHRKQAKKSNAAAVTLYFSSYSDAALAIELTSQER